MEKNCSFASICPNYFMLLFLLLIFNKIFIFNINHLQNRYDLNHMVQQCRSRSASSFMLMMARMCQLIWINTGCPCDKKRIDRVKGWQHIKWFINIAPWVCTGCNYDSRTLQPQCCLAESTTSHIVMKTGQRTNYT